MRRFFAPITCAVAHETAATEMMTGAGNETRRSIVRRRSLGFALAVLVLVVMAAFVPALASAAVSDSGTVDVQTTEDSYVTATTSAGAIVTYIGDNSSVAGGSSGTGVFDPFVRLEGSPTEQGYNTNGSVQFDTKTGKWTHAILVSHIPQRPCSSGSGTCFELWNDINESNSTPYISLNKVEVWYTTNPNLTGYVDLSGFPSGATEKYAFTGNILIDDVNSGSGRADLRYDIPIGTGTNQVSLPPNCDYGNPSCTTYFVLYSLWGTTPSDAAPQNHDYSSDGGFEEWKVKQYPAIALTKTPSPTDVCSGSSTSVTYSYTVTNNSPDGLAVSGSVVDDNGTPTNTSDDVTVGSYSKLAAGASRTFTHTFTISGTRTNTATTTATDPNDQTASATATATVTGHDCTISLTKTASVTDVCSQGGSVTYTYVVKNTGDFFKVSGTVSDDIYGSIGSYGPLAPGASATLTKTVTVSKTVTNTGTASGTFADAAGTKVSATAKATVTAHTCTISLTKTPSATTVCNGSPVTYTYVVKNTGDFFNVSGTVSDSVYGSIGSFGPLAPGTTATLSKTATITGTVTNLGTASGTFTDAAHSTATATATATVTGENCARITPTNVTCSQFTSGTAPTLSQVQYSLKNGTINQTNPGVFYYWVSVSGSSSYTITQTLSSDTLTTPFTIASGAFAYDSDCNSITSATINQDADGTVHISGSGIAVIGIKYSTGSVVGQTAPDPATVTYTFSTTGVAGSTQSIDLVQK